MRDYRGEEIAFRRAWEQLAATGACDDLGGAEYQRIAALYRLLPHGMHANDFIRWYANRPYEDYKNGKPDASLPYYS